MEDQDDIKKLKTQVIELQDAIQDCKLAVAELNVYSTVDGENIKKLGETFGKILEIVKNHDRALQLIHMTLKGLNDKFNNDLKTGQC